MNSKKELERKYLNEVNNLYQDFPKGIIIESESPDFLLNSESKTIGFELTTYNRKRQDREANDREIEFIGNKILSIAKEKFESKHNILLQVSPSWKIQRQLRFKEIELLSNSLVKIVEKNIPEVVHEFITIDNFDLWTTPLAKFCSHISIIRNQKESLWVSFEGGFITVVEQEIQELISKKIGKFSGYKEKCQAIWLIIVCEGNNISSMVDLKDVDKWKFTSPFDRILLYSRQEQAVHTLGG